ncbi:MAG: serine hydrolase [Bacteroidales bacterium]|nr:serine hydrolase [Bacteroidales bacterium]
MNHLIYPRIKKFLPALALILLLPSCHIARFFFWNFADINDHKKFQSFTVENSPATGFSFVEGDADKVKLPDSVFIHGKYYPWDEALDRTQTLAFLFIRNDSLLMEEYFRGYDETSVVPSFSMSKAFVSALTGIAIQEGRIRSVDDPVKEYIPDLPASLFPHLTIAHLLDMRSGIAFNEGYLNPFADVGKYYYGRNLRKYIRKLKPAHPPGTVFHYKSVDSQLLGMVVESATGKPLSDYLEEKLWKPLGMESPATWSIDSKKHGTVKAFCCLNAIARDYARFGRLYLNHGQWEGNSIVPAEWVTKSVTFSGPVNDFQYSYQWWHNRRYEFYNDTVDYKGLYKEYTGHTREGLPVKLVLRPQNDFFASGLLGQYIYIYPEKNIIIVRLGKKEGGLRWETLLLQVAGMN